MILLSGEYNSVGSVAQFLTVLIIFIFVLVLTYWTTRLAGGYKKQQMTGKNIQIIETVSVSASKYIQIIKLGSKYVAIAVCKDTITFLCELNEEDIDISVNPGSAETFIKIFEKLKKNEQVVNDEEKDN